MFYLVSDTCMPLAYNGVCPAVPSVYICVTLFYFCRPGSHSRCTVSIAALLSWWIGFQIPPFPCAVVAIAFNIFSSPRIHSWGGSLEEAFEQCAMGMFGYMTDTETVEPLDTVDVKSEGETASLPESKACINHTATRSLKWSACFFPLFQRWRHGVASFPLPRRLVV